MAAFNNEIASADKIGLHLSEIGRIQNNAGSLLQFTAIIFAVCVYFFNALVYPATGTHRALYGSVLAVDALLIAAACGFYLRCLTLSVGRHPRHPHPETGFYLLPALPEDQIEQVLHGIVRAFRRGTYCFAFCFFTAVLLVCLAAFGELSMIPL